MKQNARQKCEGDFRGYSPQFYSKCDRLEGEQEFSKYFEAYIAPDMVSLAGIRLEAGLGEYFFYFNSVKSTHKKFETCIKQEKQNQEKYSFYYISIVYFFSHITLHCFLENCSKSNQVNYLRDVNFCS